MVYKVYCISWVLNNNNISKRFSIYKSEFWKDFYFYKNRNITYTKNFRISGITGINQKETQKYWVSVNLV